jgi:hypothetical protein
MTNCPVIHPLCRRAEAWLGAASGVVTLEVKLACMIRFETENRTDGGWALLLPKDTDPDPIEEQLTAAGPNDE